MNQKFCCALYKKIDYQLFNYIYHNFIIIKQLSYEDVSNQPH